MRQPGCVSDINWEEDKITIHSEKTAHHQGKESRIIPLFPEIRPYLEEQYELAEPGNPFVIVTKRSKNSNLRRRFKKIVGRAGLQPWPKLFQNMRASRATELVIGEINESPILLFPKTHDD